MMVLKSPVRYPVSDDPVPVDLCAELPKGVDMHVLLAAKKGLPTASSNGVNPSLHDVTVQVLGWY